MFVMSYYLYKKTTHEIASYVVAILGLVVATYKIFIPVSNSDVKTKRTLKVSGSVDGSEIKSEYKNIPSEDIVIIGKDVKNSKIITIEK